MKTHVRLVCLVWFGDVWLLCLIDLDPDLAIIVDFGLFVPSRFQDDLSASLSERLWFDASLHQDELTTFMNSWHGTRDLHCIDLFGFSGSIAKQWTKAGFKAQQYDILLNPRSDDLLSRRGYLHLTRFLVLYEEKNAIFNLFYSDPVYMFKMTP